MAEIVGNVLGWFSLIMLAAFGALALAGTIVVYATEFMDRRNERRMGENRITGALDVLVVTVRFDRVGPHEDDTETYVFEERRRINPLHAKRYAETLLKQDRTLDHVNLFRVYDGEAVARGLYMDGEIVVL